MEPSKIVVRYLDGRILKGTTRNFSPLKPTFQLLPGGRTTLVEVSVSHLKAVFFVRDFLGNKLYRERKKVAEGDKPQGRLVEVTCRDGEVLVGSTMGYDPGRPGFFLHPIDPKTNNTKIFLTSAGVAKVRYF
ncbi:MAG TPA: hypothetical protein DD658_05320 [Deltaproteobacteria bacterium]|nr:MAG: hypothetical protein A2X88_07855 [Deltaproteobacteria bacterium GWC2_65_14]HBO69580.1 hypothetical protein [Deltaproteobacteria bacterium]